MQWSLSIVFKNRITLDYVTHGLCFRNELTAERAEASGTCYFRNIKNRGHFLSGYKRKGDSQATLPQTGSSDWAATGLGLATATMAVLLFPKKHQ